MRVGEFTSCYRAHLCHTNNYCMRPHRADFGPFPRPLAISTLCCTFRHSKAWNIAYECCMRRQQHTLTSSSSSSNRRQQQHRRCQHQRQQQQHGQHRQHYSLNAIIMPFLMPFTFTRNKRQSVALTLTLASLLAAQLASLLYVPRFFMLCFVWQMFLNTLQQVIVAGCATNKVNDWKENTRNY